MPASYSQLDLEDLFKTFGLISSAKVNENGVAFVRYEKRFLCFLCFCCVFCFLFFLLFGKHFGNAKKKNRYMKADDAAKAIQALNDSRPTEEFEENIVVKLAH